MRYESLENLSEVDVERILYSASFEDEIKIKALYTAIYNHGEEFSSKMILHCMQSSILDKPTLAARSVSAFMQSRRTVVGSTQFLVELNRLIVENPDHEGELQEIIDDVEELKTTFK